MSDTTNHGQALGSHDFGTGRGKLRNGLVIGGLIMAVGLWAFLIAGDSLPDGKPLGLALVAGGLVFCLWTWRTSHSGRILLRLSLDGIWFEPWGEATVPWHAIGRIYARGGRLRRFLCVELADEGKVLLASLPTEQKKALERSTLTRLPLLFIPYGAVDAPPAELGELMRSYLSASR